MISLVLFSHPEADFLVHRPTYTIDGKFTVPGLRELVGKKARAEERFISLLSMLTGTPEQRVEELFNNGDNYIEAKEAQALGIIDHIVPVLKPSA